MKEELLREYARLAVRMGVNLQKGQKLVVRAGVDSAYFVRLVTEEAYAAGARDVIVHWSDEKIARERYLHAENDVFDEAYPWQVQMFDLLSAEGAAFLSVTSSDPAALAGVDPDDRLPNPKWLKEYGPVMSPTVKSQCGRLKEIYV